MKRPWNLPNVPVYSLATYDGNSVNMNICIYVSAVSMKPKRYMIAIDHQTQTFENMCKSKLAVLQFLGKDHLPIVNTLSKKSGRDYDKERYLRHKKLLTVWNGKDVLSDSAALVEIEKIWQKDAGDHTMFLFDVRKFVTCHNQILMLDALRAKGLIRI